MYWVGGRQFLLFFSFWVILASSFLFTQSVDGVVVGLVAQCVGIGVVQVQVAVGQDQRVSEVRQVYYVFVVVVVVFFVRRLQRYRGFKCRGVFEGQRQGFGQVGVQGRFFCFWLFIGYFLRFLRVVVVKGSLRGRRKVIMEQDLDVVQSGVRWVVGLDLVVFVLRQRREFVSRFYIDF